MTRSRVALVVIVLTVVATAGTLAADERDERDDEEIDADEILEGVEETDTYRYQMNQTVESDRENVTVTSEGVVDEANERLYTSMTTERDALPGGAIEMEQYVIGDTQYVELQGVWHEVDVSESDVWDDQAGQLGEQADLIETGELAVVGTDTVNDVETTVIRVDATDDFIEELEEAQAEPETEPERDVDEAESTDVDELDVEIVDVTYHFYVDEETNLLHRTEMEMTTIERGTTVNSTVEITFFDHGEPVDVELPAEAEDAEPIETQDEEPTTPRVRR